MLFEGPLNGSGLCNGLQRKLEETQIRTKFENSQENG